MTSRLDAYAGRTAPRYTSCPTARAFSDLMTPAAFQMLAGRVAGGGYLHVPFTAHASVS